MSFSNGPKGIVTDGLVFSADAGNTQCYTSGSATATDLIGNNTLTLTNGSAPAIQPFPSSWGFDGTDDYMDTSTALSSAGDLSYVFWGYITDYDTGAGGHNQRLFHNYDGTADLQCIVSETSKFCWGSSIDGAGQGIVVRPATGTWTHFGLTREGAAGTDNNWKVYYSGSLQIQAARTPGNPSPTTQTLRIAGDIAGTGLKGTFDGKIGCMLIYNKALTQSEVLQNYNSQKARFGL